MPMTQGRSEPAELVESFADSRTRVQMLGALQALGAAALPAVRQGLKHQNWHVPHWCAIFLDRHRDVESLQSLLPLLHDPVSRVRLWAVHSISCEHCKNCEGLMDEVPLLIDRIENDANKRVRKMAVAMLAILPPDLRVVPGVEAGVVGGGGGKKRPPAQEGLQ